MGSAIQDNIDKLVSHFEGFESWEDKYKEVIRIGKKLEPMPQEFITDSNKVKGCQSQVWLFPDLKEKQEILYFYAESDALIAKGLVALVLSVYNSCTPAEILQTEPSFIARIGLDSYLSPNRSNGLLAMVKQIKMYALALSQRQA